jgi:hypothetical protein
MLLLFILILGKIKFEFIILDFTQNLYGYLNNEPTQVDD